MAKTTTRERIEFPLDHNGKKYSCYRVVTEGKLLSQRIEVVGVGSKSDDAYYGRGGHPVETMESIARFIAHEIINEAGTG